VLLELDDDPVQQVGRGRVLGVDAVVDGARCARRRAQPRRQQVDNGSDVLLAGRELRQRL
jgi:hypothetical protein